LGDGTTLEGMYRVQGGALQRWWDYHSQQHPHSTTHGRTYVGFIPKAENWRVTQRTPSQSVLDDSEDEVFYNLMLTCIIIVQLIVRAQQFDCSLCCLDVSRFMLLPAPW
jgi:hypothetical protein